MKKIILVTTCLFLSLNAFAEKKKSNTRKMASVSDAQPVKGCGELVVREDGEKIIYDAGSMTGYVLIIDEVAAPRGVIRELIKYESNVYSQIKVGMKYCVLGLKGSEETLRKGSLINVINFSIISEN